MNKDKMRKSMKESGFSSNISDKSIDECMGGILDKMLGEEEANRVRNIAEKSFPDKLTGEKS